MSESKLPTPSQIEDIRLAASKMTGARRRSFQAEMAEKYSNGSARLAEKVFGWSRESVQTGLGEKRTGIICLGAQPTFGGNIRWEERHPEVAEAWRALAEEHAQQDPTFPTTLSYSRLTAKQALKQLRAQGDSEEPLACKSSMADILNRLGYRLRKVVKAKPRKKVPETEAIFNNIKEKNAQAKSDAGVKRLSLDGKATVKIGHYSRGGKTRADNQADDHDIGCTETYTPFGGLDEDSGPLHIMFGSSYKTSDFIVDSLIQWWDGLSLEEQQSTTRLQMKVDNGPESSGVWTQFLNRMVSFAQAIEQPIQLVYYPPHYSKYNPIERGWGILERRRNGAKRTEAETRLEWAKGMTWKGIHPIISLSQKVYEKGVKLTKKAMKAIEAKLKRNPLLPKWDILIQPT